MKVIKKLWGLLVDDGRLASILVIGLVVAAVFSVFAHVGWLGSAFIWLGLVVSLIVSVEHELRVKLAKTRKA